MVECQLPKLDVAGSTPVARSTQSFHLKCIHQRITLLTLCPPAGINGTSLLFLTAIIWGQRDIGGQRDMIDYPKDDRAQLVTILASLPDSRWLVFNLVHSFGGRGSPRA